MSNNRRSHRRAAFAASVRAERAAARGSALMDLEHEGRVFYTTLASAARAALSLTAGMVQHGALDGPFTCAPSNSAAAHLRSTHAEFCRFAEAAEAVYMRYERLKLQEIKQRFGIG